VFARAEIRRERYDAFKNLARSVAFAYQQHPSRTEWSAYATVAGPSLSVYVIIPLASLGAMDEMVSLDRVMTDVYGSEGQVKLAEFQSCVLHMNTSVLNRIDLGVGSGPAPSEPTPYLYYVNLKVNPAGADRFLNGMRQLGALMPDSPFTMYGTFAGVTRVHAFALGSCIADLEMVGKLQSRIVSGYGEEMGGQIWAGIHDGLEETETSILRHIGHQEP
jgi:hypothetical protein